MRLLAALLAVLLLAGCASQPAETKQATGEDALHVPGHSLETRTSGIMQVFPTEADSFCQLWAMGEDLLLQSGGVLTRLSGPNLTPQARMEAQTVLHSGGDGVWLFDGSAVSVLDENFTLLQTVSVPDPVVGVPGLDEDGRALYYLTDGSLKKLDLASGLASLLRDGMTFTDGSVSGLGAGSLLLHLTDEEGTGSTLLLSAADGSTLHPELTVSDASRMETGLCVLLEDGQAVLLPEEGEASRVLLREGEQVLGFLPEINGLYTAISGSTGVTVGLYDLSAGVLRSSVLLPDIDLAGQCRVTSDGNIYLTAHSAAENAWWILKWNYTAFPPESKESCLEPYYTRDNPDNAGQAACRAQAQTLGKRYGITVLVFGEAAEAAPWDYAFTPAYRVDKTQWALTDLESTLAAFPEGFLEALKQDWDDLTVCIVDSIRGTAESGSLDSAEGLQFQNGAHYYIALAPQDEDSLKHTLFHEFSHLIDTQVMNRSSAYDNWNDLNPQDFAYSLDVNADMTPYKALLTGPDRAFVDDYAMTFPSEDRARIFECACTPGNREIFDSPIMQAKLRQICTGIREAFGLKNTEETLLWEQYLT